MGSSCFYKSKKKQLNKKQEAPIVKKEEKKEIKEENKSLIMKNRDKEINKIQEKKNTVIIKSKKSSEETEIKKEKQIDNIDEEKEFYYYEDENIKIERESLTNNEGDIEDSLNKSIEKSIEIDESKLQNQLNIDFGDEIEIYSVIELTNNRIAVLDNEVNKVKIYSLKNWKLITEINQEFIKNIIEINNNDLVINSNSKIYFYKLLPNQSYELYQTIDEYAQGTFTVRKYNTFLDKKGDKYYNLNSVYQLINGDLVSCNSYGIKIYKRDIDHKYKLSFKNKIEEEIVKAIEIKKNLLLLFRFKCDRPSVSFFCTIYNIYKYDMENQKITEISGHSINDVDHSVFTLEYFNYYINNDYLFIRYGNCLQVFNLNAKLIYEKYVYGFEKDLPIKEFFCNYGDNLFIVGNLNEDYKNKIEIYYYKNKNFKEIKTFDFIDSDTKGAIKIKNNDFIFY